VHHRLKHEMELFLCLLKKHIVPKSWHYFSWQMWSITATHAVHSCTGNVSICHLWTKAVITVIYVLCIIQSI